MIFRFSKFILSGSVCSYFQVRYVQSLKEIAIDIPSQQAVTSGLKPKRYGCTSEHYTLFKHYNLWHCAGIIDDIEIVTSDNVPVNIDGVLFLHITDTFKASYEVQLWTSLSDADADAEGRGPGVCVDPTLPHQHQGGAWQTACWSVVQGRSPSFINIFLMKMTTSVKKEENHIV